MHNHTISIGDTELMNGILMSLKTLAMREDMEAGMRGGMTLWMRVGLKVEMWEGATTWMWN
jgi:hypothetical protein